MIIRVQQPTRVVLPQRQAMWERRPFALQQMEVVQHAWEMTEWLVQEQERLTEPGGHVQ